MNRVKIKTGEQIKSIKTLDRAAAAGERMKSAYIRTKAREQENRQDRVSSSRYAESRMEDAAWIMARNTVRTASFGGKGILRKGRTTSNENRDRVESDSPGIHKEAAFSRDDSSPDPQAQKRQYRRYFRYPERTSIPQALDGPTPTPYSPPANLALERGRDFAKKQAVKRRETARQLKTRDVFSAVQPEDPGHFSPEAVWGQAMRVIRQRAQKGQGVSGWNPKAKNAFPGFPLKSGEGATQGAQKAEKLAAHASRTAAKAAAVSAKKLAKASTAAVKGILAAAKALAATIAAGGWVAVLVVVVICLVGQLVCSGFGIFFSGEDKGTGQTVTTAVQEMDREFEDRLAEIQACVDYDILDMSSSPAPWPNVLAVYAVKTTSDPDNGQEVVTMDDIKKELLRAVFWEMNSITSSITVRTYEVSGTTTDENGNTVESTDTETEVTLHITISHRTASEMADAYHFNDSQREQLDFLLSSENSNLWDALLQGAGGGGNGGNLVSVALSQVGNVGGQPYWSWYGFDSRVEWCACFVSWCANESGCLGTAVLKFSRCVDGVAWFRRQGRWQNSGYLPQPGDIIFFDWDTGGGQDGIPDHVGIVERVEGGTIYTIEGNSAGDQCRQNRYTVESYLIYGYGRIS